MILRFLAIATACVLSSFVPKPVAAWQATPAALDLGPCTTEPRSNEAMRAQMLQRLPEIVNDISGTPRSDSVDRPSIDAGVPADPETVAAVTDTLHQLFACQAAGNLPATAAVLTEYGGGTFLGYGVFTFAEGVQSVDLIPGEPIDPQLIDLFLGAAQMPAPLPAEYRAILYGVEDVRDLGGGHYSTITVLAAGDDEPTRNDILLIEEDGALHDTFGAEPGFTRAVATPVP